MTTQHTPPAVEQWAVDRIKQLEQQRDDLLVKLDAIEMCLQMADECASDYAGLPQDSSTRLHIKHGLDICAKARGQV